MSSPKEDVAKMLDALPDTASFEDIQYHLHVLQTLRRREERIDIDGTVSHAEAKERLKKWLEK